MNPQTTDHKGLLSEVIKKQIVILGPDITLAKARNVPGLTVADDGTVTGLVGDPQVLTQKLIEQFMELSGMIVKKTMEPLLASYPAAATMPIPTPMPQPASPAPVMPQPAIQPPTPTPNPTVPNVTSPVQTPTQQPIQNIT